MFVPGSVTSAKIHNNQIGVQHFSKGSVTAGKLAQAVVDSIHLNGQVVDSSSQFASESIVSANLEDGLVTERTLTGKVSGRVLASGSISGRSILDGSVVSSVLASNSIQSRHLAKAIITDAHISSSAITAEKIVDGAISRRNLVHLSITENNIAPSSITASILDRQSISSSKISSVEVFANANIANIVLDNGHFQADSVVARHFANGSVLAEKIIPGSVTSSVIRDGSVTAAKLSSSVYAEDLLSLTFGGAVSEMTVEGRFTVLGDVVCADIAPFSAVTTSDNFLQVIGNKSTFGSSWRKPQAENNFPVVVTVNGVPKIARLEVDGTSMEIHNDIGGGNGHFASGVALSVQALHFCFQK